MSVTTSLWHTAEVPLGTPLAKVEDNGDLTLWPQGIGVGPAITMTLRDWHMLRFSADEAIKAQRLRLQSYAATEGNGVGDE